MQNNNNMNYPYNMPEKMPMPSMPQMPQMPPMMDKMANQMVFPEIFYKLQPYIIMICDQMEALGSFIPSQEMAEEITDSIYEDVCKMYPDMAEYARSCEKSTNDDPPEIGRDNRFFRRNFRRRGMFRDIIDILLLSELQRRRRRFFI